MATAQHAEGRPFRYDEEVMFGNTLGAKGTQNTKILATRGGRPIDCDCGHATIAEHNHQVRFLKRAWGEA